MSTRDPLSDLIGSSDRPARTPMLALTVMTVSFLAFGVALGNVATYPISGTYLPDALRPANGTPSLLWLFFVSLALGALAGIAAQKSLHRCAGFAMMMAVTTGVPLAATAVGMVVGAARYWAEPGGTGRLDGVGARIGWTSQWWLPALLIVVAAVMLVAGRRRSRRTRAASDARTASMRSGVRVDGVVTAAHDTGVRIMGEYRIRYVVRYRDRSDTERWVSRTELFNRAAMPRAGDEVAVWYDPARPDDDERIAVALRHP